MAAKRSFRSIQAVPDKEGLALIAVADDGTAWAARSRLTNGHMLHDNLEWKRLTDLPDNENIKPLGVLR